MSLLKKMTTFSIIGITFIFLLSVVWNISRQNSALDGNDWLKAHQLQTMNNDRSLPQLNYYTLNDVFESNNKLNDPYFENNLSDWYGASDSGYGTSLTLQNGQMRVYINNGSHIASKFRSSYQIQGDTNYYFRLSVYADAGSNYHTYYNGNQYLITKYLDLGWNDISVKYQNASHWNNSLYMQIKSHSPRSWQGFVDNVFLLDLDDLGLDHLTEEQLNDFYDLYEYNKGNQVLKAGLNNYTLNEIFYDGNLIPNPYFEQIGFDGLPIYWSRYSNASLYYNEDTKYMEVDTIGGLTNFYDSINITCGNKFYISMDSYYDYTGSSYPRSRVVFRTSTGSWSQSTSFFGNTPTIHSTIHQSTSSQCRLELGVLTDDIGNTAYLREPYVIDMTSYNITALQVELDLYLEEFKVNSQNSQEDIYINYHDYNYIEQGSKTINTFLTYWDTIMSTFDTAKWLSDLVIGDTLNTYDYYEYEELYLLWNDNRYYLDPLTQLKYNMLLYEKGLYYLVYMDQSSGSHEELFRTLLDYEDLDHYNSQYFWINKE